MCHYDPLSFTDIVSSFLFVCYYLGAINGLKLFLGYLLGMSLDKIIIFRY